MVVLVLSIMRPPKKAPVLPTVSLLSLCLCGRGITGARQATGARVSQSCYRQEDIYSYEVRYGQVFALLATFHVFTLLSAGLQ